MNILEKEDLILEHLKMALVHAHIAKERVILYELRNTKGFDKTMLQISNELKTIQEFVSQWSKPEE